jgi:hypothetical protein
MKKVQNEQLLSSQNLKRNLLHTLRPASSLIGSALLAVSVMVPAAVRPAYADGSDCSPQGSPTLCFNVYGDGNYIHNMEAHWLGYSLCNWRIDWVIHYQGKTWWRDKGPVHTSCSHVRDGRTRGQGNAPIGSQFCAELYNTSRNRKIREACVDITP